MTKDGFMLTIPAIGLAMAGWVYLWDWIYKKLGWDDG